VRVRRTAILAAAVAFAPAARAALYHCDLGDGTTAEGVAVPHVYGAGVAAVYIH
jgi:hypothetical protein